MQSLSHGTSRVSPVHLVFPMESWYVAVGQRYRTLLSLSPTPPSLNGEPAATGRAGRGNPSERLRCPPGDAFQSERMMFACLAGVSVSLQRQELIVLCPSPSRVGGSACLADPVL